MKKVLIIFILLLMTVPESFCQETKIAEKDLNGDGCIDILKSFYDGGSMFGGEFVSLMDGRTKERYEYNRWGSHGQFLRLIPFSNKLLKPENRGFKEAIETALFPGMKHRNTDPSLGWLINAYLTSETDLNHELFSQKILFRPKWRKGALSLPGSYFTVTSDERLFTRYPIYEERNPRYDQHHRQGWLVYDGKHHENLTPIDTPDGYNIYKTAHGVILSKGDQYVWVFINDEVLMDGPPKLKWPSIKKVVLSNQLVFVLHWGGVENLFVIDFDKGIVGRVMESQFPKGEKNFEVREGRFIIQSGAKIERIDLENIKRKLR